MHIYIYVIGYTYMYLNENISDFEHISSAMACEFEF